MSDGIAAAVAALQEGDEALVRAAFAWLAAEAHQEPDACAAALSRAVRAELAGGALRTPRLLTLLGLTREPQPELVEPCVELLRARASGSPRLPTDATLGAAATVARTRPRALLPDIEAMSAEPAGATDDQVLLWHALQLLMAISGGYLREMPNGAATDMVRCLWRDCAACDLMTVADLTALHVGAAGADSPMVDLVVELVEILPVDEDRKRYAGQRLQEAGVDGAAAAWLRMAWRAMVAAPVPAMAHDDGVAEADPDPPAPDPRVDEALVAFAAGTGVELELARPVIEAMFEEPLPPPSLGWWLLATVDSLPPERRRTEAGWALIWLASGAGRRGKLAVPPSVLTRWLDTPQLLDRATAPIALHLLAMERPDLVARRYLHRVVALSGGSMPEMPQVQHLWSDLARAERAAVCDVLDRWVDAGFGESALTTLLRGLTSGEPGR